MPKDDDTTRVHTSGEHVGNANASDVLAALTAFRKEVTTEFRQIREGMANEFRGIHAGMTKGVERFTEHEGRIRHLEDFKRDHQQAHRDADREAKEKAIDDAKSAKDDEKERRQPGLLLTVIITVIATIGASALVQIIAAAIVKNPSLTETTR